MVSAVAVCTLVIPHQRSHSARRVVMLKRKTAIARRMRGLFFLLNV